MSTATPTPEIIQRLVSILRRDLKLGPDALLNESTPLLGGQHDLDSLDILLMLTSVEKEFGIRIPNEALQQHAFRNLATLAEFIERQPVAGSHESSQAQSP